MFFYFPAIFQSIFFVLILGFISYYGNFFWLLFFVFLVYVFLTFRPTAKTWDGWYIGLIFFISAWTILHLIDYDIERRIFVILAGLVNYFLIFGIYRIKSKPDSRTAKAVIAMSLMAVAFLFFTATYGVYLNFDVSAWTLMVFYFVNIGLMSYQYFLLIGENRKKIAALYSLILGFVSLEMAWIVNFWPFGYLTTGVILLMFYYIIWDIAQNYFLNILSIRKVVINLIFFLLTSAVVLYSSPWLTKI